MLREAADIKDGARKMGALLAFKSFQCPDRFPHTFLCLLAVCCRKQGESLMKEREREGGRERDRERERDGKAESIPPVGVVNRLLD